MFQPKIFNCILRIVSSISCVFSIYALPLYQLYLLHFVTKGNPFPYSIRCYLLKRERESAQQFTLSLFRVYITTVVRTQTLNTTGTTVNVKCFFFFFLSFLMYS